MEQEVKEDQYETNLFWFNKLGERVGYNEENFKRDGNIPEHSEIKKLML